MSKRSYLLLTLLTSLSLFMQAQPCTNIGQTPSTAFPVCGTTTFTQLTVPLCSTNDIFVPGCSGTGDAIYQNKNPYYYKFTCYVAGTLGFVINPLAMNEDYDWQLYDITGHDPNQIFTNTSLVVIGNWAGTYGATGASAAGIAAIGCASNPADNEPTFSKMPNLIAGHEYLLMISHFTDGQSGYDLSFVGGTAVITDPLEPHLLSAKPDCDGTTLRVKMNKKMRCNSLTPAGSEFTISPAVATVISAVAANCSGGFDFDEVVLTLSAPLSNGNYQLIINAGTDGTTVLDHCDRPVPPAEQVPFVYSIPEPIFADSIGAPGCAPDEIKVYFPKRIDCSTIAGNGSNFIVNGPTAVNVISADGNCVDGFSDIITVKFSSPIFTKGNYTLTLQAATDGTPIMDECNLVLPIHSLPFRTEDTVSAEFNMAPDLGCRLNTLTFSHDGAHDVGSWHWTFNDSIHANTQSYTIVFPASSSNLVTLAVNNGVCADSVARTVVMDNEVVAKFEMPPIICPEDPLVVQNNSEGLINTWRWTFGNVGTSSLQDPTPVQFPMTNVETNYNIRLICTNSTLGCSDTLVKTLKVLDNCFIAVPTAFTPNNDGLNDFLYPNNAIKAADLDFKVFNRWGQMVFHSRDWTKKWDGKINGILQSPGVFVWMLEYTNIVTGKKHFEKGTTTLIR